MGYICKTTLKTASAEPTDGYSLACVIKADMSNMRGALRKGKGPKGMYWTLAFEVAIMFGGTELAASIVWEDAQVRLFLPRFSSLCCSLTIC